MTPTYEAILLPSLIVPPGGTQTNRKLWPQSETSIVSGHVAGFRGAVLVRAHLRGVELGFLGTRFDGPVLAWPSIVFISPIMIS